MRFCDWNGYKQQKILKYDKGIGENTYIVHWLYSQKGREYNDAQAG